MIIRAPTRVLKYKKLNLAHLDLVREELVHLDAGRCGAKGLPVDDRESRAVVLAKHVVAAHVAVAQCLAGAVVQHRVEGRDELGRVPAAAIGLALSNLAPK